MLREFIDALRFLVPVVGLLLLYAIGPVTVISIGGALLLEKFLE